MTFAILLLDQINTIEIQYTVKRVLGRPCVANLLRKDFREIVVPLGQFCRDHD